MPYIKKFQSDAGNLYDLRDIEAFHYAGQLGTGATADVPSASASNKGDIYEVITAGTYDGKSAVIGDLFVSTGTKWILIQTTNITYSFASGDANGQIKVTPSNGQAQNVSVTGLDNAAYKDYTSTVTENSTDLVTSGGVYTAIANLPKPMVFRGTVGTNGTIATLPVDGSADIGDTYKVITAGTYAGIDAKVGDVFTCLTKTVSANTWELIPAGDTDSDTWRAILVNGVQVLSNGITSGNLDFIDGKYTAVTFDSSDNTIKFEIPELATTTIGSASAGTAIAADEITNWTANTPTAVSLPTLTVQDEVLIFSAGTVTPGSAASLTHTAKSIPNISVSQQTVVTGFDVS